MSQDQFNRWTQHWPKVFGDVVQQAEQVAQTQQRHGKLAVTTLVETLVLGWLQNPSASLSDLAQTAHQLGSSVTASSLNERLTPRVVLLLAAVLQQCLRQRMRLDKLPVGRLRDFSAIYLLDSTQVSLPGGLYEPFRGNGTNAKLKLQVVLDYLHSQVQMIECQAGRTPDQQCELFNAMVQADALLLFDLGYFKQETLRDIQQTGAFFVTRCQSQVALYDPVTDQAVSLSERLSQQASDQFEAILALGARVKTPVRLVARRVTAAVAAARRRHAKAKAKRQGKTCRSTYLAGLDWEVLVTNLPLSWSVEELFVLYGLRWQIELVFKAWKSQLGLTRYGPWRAERVLCQLYAHLIGALLCHHTYAGFCCLPDGNLSFAKSVAVIQQAIPALLPIIRHRWRGLTRWAHDVEAALLRYARHDKRKTTPTTLQFLINWGLT